MNMFLKVMLSFALCYVVGVLPAFAEIRNHHIFYRQDTRAPLTRIDIVFPRSREKSGPAFSNWACKNSLEN